MSSRYNVRIIIALSLRVALFYNMTKCETVPRIKKFFGSLDGVIKNILTSFIIFLIVLNIIKICWSGNNLIMNRTNSTTSRLVE